MDMKLWLIIIPIWCMYRMKWIFYSKNSACSLINSIKLVKYMPKLEAFFHYRNLDVSTVKELARRWRPDVLEGVKKHGSHLALDDIRDSINELRHYRDHFFKL